MAPFQNTLTVQWKQSTDPPQTLRKACAGTDMGQKSKYSCKAGAHGSLFTQGHGGLNTWGNRTQISLYKTRNTQEITKIQRRSRKVVESFELWETGSVSTADSRNDFMDL